MTAIPEDLKVINLGFPKSGTTTLGEALKHAGMRVADWKIRPGQSETMRGFVGKLMYEGYYKSGDPLEFLFDFNAFTEIEVVREGKNLWPQTDWALLTAIRAKHPGAKFILSKRDAIKHADSMRRWSNLGRRRLPGNAVPGLPEGYGREPGELERWIDGHVAFCRKVFDNADDFLEYDVEDADAQDRIAGFLGIELPWWGKANANETHPGESESAGLMRIIVHIGMPQCGAEALQTVLDDKRGQLLQKGVLYASSLGRKNHTKLYMAVSDPGHVDPMRFARGFATSGAQERLQRMVAQDLAGEVARHNPELLVLSAHQLATLPNRSELERLRALLAPLSDDISILAHVDEQARVLTRHYAEAVGNGRVAGLEQELGLVEAENWRAAALADWGRIAPAVNGFPELQAAPHWLDYCAIVALWEEVFGAGKVTLRPYDPAGFGSGEIVDELREMLGIKETIGKAEAPALPAPPSAPTLARWRQLSGVFVRLLENDKVIPRQLWMRLLDEVAVAGAPIDPAALSGFSKRFETGNKALAKAHPALTEASLKRGRAKGSWAEADPGQGFRATQFAAAFLPRIDAATQQARKAAASAAADLAARRSGGAEAGQLTASAEKLMNDRAKENFYHLRDGRFAPHNRLGRVNEEELAAAFAELPMRDLPKGQSGNVIVGCMKNEAPYILEWVAYHRMIGIDNFIIYTNDCTDGTDELLDRMQELGVLQHRYNNDWKGNSPQQHALNKSLKEPVIQNAEWVIHIDVDEFINIRVGNGMLADFLDRVPDATNVAMTWRLFGHNDVAEYRDALIIEQFDSAAPKYCPKPHTTWGFKTMTKNVGAYEKFSCHRPNKLRPAPEEPVKWVNGSGQEMSENYHERGWRSDLKTIGYDMLQLNHYALRSAESFLVKRQRGRALHVDRSIGINYWVRMDWGGNKDVTIQRNIPRVRAEMARLLQDGELSRLHEAGVVWHKDKARELQGNPEFQELYAQALETKLTEMERVAFALALDMES